MQNGQGFQLNVET